MGNDRTPNANLYDQVRVLMQRLQRALSQLRALVEERRALRRSEPAKPGPDGTPNDVNSWLDAHGAWRRKIDGLQAKASDILAQIESLEAEAKRLLQRLRTTSGRSDEDAKRLRAFLRTLPREIEALGIDPSDVIEPEVTDHAGVSQPRRDRPPPASP